MKKLNQKISMDECVEFLKDKDSAFEISIAMQCIADVGIKSISLKITYPFISIDYIVKHKKSHEKDMTIFKTQNLQDAINYYNEISSQ